MSKSFLRFCFITFLFVGLFTHLSLGNDRIINIGVLKNNHQLNKEGVDITSCIFTDLLNEIAKLENWELKYIEIDDKDSKQKFMNHKIDLLLVTPYTAKNRDVYIFSNETVVSTWGQVFVQNGMKINSLLDLEGKSVAFLDGDAYFEEFQNTIQQFNISCDLVVSKDYLHVLEAVDKGFVDAGVVERTFGYEYHHNYNISETPIIFSPTELRFACLREENTNLIHTIDYYLALFKRDQNSVYYALIQKYFGPDTSFVFPIWLRWFLIFIGFAVLILIVSTIILKGQVKNRTRELSDTLEKLTDEIKVRKEHESDLLKLGTVVQQMLEGVIITDTQGIVEYVNPGFELMSGRTRDSMMGEHFKKLFKSNDSKLFMENMLKTVKSGNLWRGRIKIELQKDNFSEMEASILPIHDSSNNIENFLCILRDLTHEALLERQLRQSQKMEAIGTLAGGIAHDFNNTLFTMMGQTDLAMLLLNSDDPVYAMLSKVLRAGQRAKDLVKQILTFSRQGERERQIMEIQPIIKETMTLIRPALPTTIEIRTEFNADKTLVETDPTHIHQILLNLCTNAAHALPENNGILDVRLRTIEIGESQPDLNLSPGQYVKLSVKDNGHGISSKNLERIFEPFFTTKDLGEGTGMGLAVVHGIVEGHKGTITVESEINKGTIFNIYLPVIYGEVQHQEEITVEDRMGHERIMVVDDEEDVIEVLCAMLRHLKYEVEGFTDSREALRIFCEKPDNYDLLITDFSMPGLTGAQLSEQVLSKRASMPIIMITGYGQYMTTESARTIGVNELMIKPVMISDLADVIRRVLDEDMQAELL